MEDTHRLLVTNRNQLRVKVRVHLFLHIFFQHLQHHRVIVTENIQLNQAVVDAVIIVMGGDGGLVGLIRRMVHGRDIVNIHIARHYHDATGVLTRRALNAGQALHQLGNFGRMDMTIIFFVVFLDIAHCSFVSHSGDGACTAHIVATKKLLRILMRNFLVGHGMGTGVIRVVAAGKI